MIRERLEKLAKMVENDTLAHTGEFVLWSRNAGETDIVILAAYIERHDDNFVLDLNHECYAIFIPVEWIVSVEPVSIGTIEIKFRDCDGMVTSRLGDLIQCKDGLFSFNITRFELRRVLKHIEL